METHRTNRLDRREILLIFAFWTFLAVLSAVSRTMNPRGFGFRWMSPAGPMILAFVESWLWALLTPPIFLLAGYASRERKARATQVLLLLAAGVAVSILVYFLLAVARDQLFEVVRRRRALRPVSDVLAFRFVPQLLFYFAILAAGFAREYFLRDRERQAHAARLQAQLAEAKLDALRTQMNPHFLFNTLHAVSAMVERDPAGVRKMIARLSDLLRHTIDAHATDEVPLRDELQLLGRYIEIMEVRFRGRLRVEQRIDPATLEIMVPNLVMQPLVENALEHGAGRAAGEGRVEIASRLEAGRLLLTVRDNGPGPGSSPRPGVGLANTRARLDQLYGGDASLRLEAGPGGGTVAELTIPLRGRRPAGAGFTAESEP